MADRYIVVDGSNIATEGREMPSLAQLDAAVQAFMQDRAPDEELIVVVDATFGHRIDQSEKAEFEQAERAGEIVSPPAGAIGRGDAFLLQVADRTNAVVLSNDSFQEFHAEYPWLFDDGRLIGGKPVPRVGWFFTPRTPVRGPKSREAMRAAKKGRKSPVRRAAVAEGPVAEAIAEATAEAIAPDLALALTIAPADEVTEDGEGGRGGRRIRRRRAKPVGAVNDPLPFIQFIADYPLGSEVEAEVETFTSHGAFVKVGDARCYLPLSALADPAPRSAKEVLNRGEVRTFIVQALDPPRRGIELAMPGVARVAGTPTEETVEADIGAGRKASRRRDGADVVPIEAAAGKRTRRKRATAVVEAAVAEAAVAEGDVAEGDVAEGDVAEADVGKPRRSRRAAAAGGEAGAAAPAKRARKAAKAAAAAIPAPSSESALAEAPPVEDKPEPTPPVARRSRRATSAVVTEPKPARTRKAAAPPMAERQVESEPAPARRSRKKSVAAPVEAVAVPAPEADAEAVQPAKAARKRAVRKAATEPEPAPAPAPVKRSRKKSAG